MLDVRDYNIFDIKTELDAVEHWYQLNACWERIKRGESYKNITVAQLKEILEYKKSIEIKLDIEQEQQWNEWLETDRGQAYTADPELYDELQEIQCETIIREERVEVRERNKYLEELYKSSSFQEKVEKRTGKPYDPSWEWFVELPKLKLPHLNNEQLYERYNSIIKLFRMKGFNLR